MSKSVYWDAYYALNKEKIKARKNNWYKNPKNKKKIKAWGARAKEYAVGYREKNKEKIKILYRAWASSFRGRLNRRVRQRNRNQMLKDLSLNTVQAVYEENIKIFGTLTCYLCLKPISFGDDHLEHKTPLARGGGNGSENLAVACKSCNWKKHSKTVEEFLCRRK